MPSFIFDTDQLSVQKVGFLQQLTYGDNFNLNFFLVQSGVPYSASASDSITFVLYKQGLTNPGGSAQNLAIVGAPALKVNSAGISYLQVNISLLTAQLASQVQTPGTTMSGFIHCKYLQADGEVYSLAADVPVTIAPDNSASSLGTTAQAPAGYPAPGNLIVYSPIINGDFSVNQRLSTLTGLGSTSVLYAMDKWKVQTSALTGRFTITQDQQTIVGNLPYASSGWTATSSIKIQCTTAQASPAAGDFFTLSQFIESALWTPMLNTPFSVAFLYKTNLAFTLGLFVQDQALAYNYVVPIALIGDSNWHLATASILQPPSLATWNINDAANGFSAKVGFCFFSGATLTAGANNQWNTAGGDVAPIGIGNFLSSTSNFLQLTQVALSPGSFAQPWAQLPPLQNLQLCQRYFSKSYALLDAPGTAARISGPMMVAISATTSLANGLAKYPVTMRAAGTPVLYGPSSGTVNKAYNFVASAEVTVTGASQINEKGFSGITASAALPALGSPSGSHWGIDVDY